MGLIWILLVWSPETRLFIPVTYTQSELYCKMQRYDYPTQSICISIPKG